MAVTMEELQMLEVEEEEDDADFCLFTCGVSCAVTNIVIKPTKQ